MSSHSSPFILMKRIRFKTLLVVLFLLLIATPAASALGSGALITAFFGLTFFAAAGAVADNRRTMWRFCVVAGLCLVLYVIRSLADSFAWHAASHICGMMYLLFVIYLLLKHIFSNRVVTTDTICAALCVYLLIGITWAFGYSLIDRANPDAFHFSEETAQGRVEGPPIGFGSANSTSAVYFSFVTLCTLGYGDIFPKTPTAQMAAVAEAIVGQLYLAVLVARLVGLHIASSDTEDSQPE